MRDGLSVVICRCLVLSVTCGTHTSLRLAPKITTAAPIGEVHIELQIRKRPIRPPLAVHLSPKLQKGTQHYYGRCCHVSCLQSASRSLRSSGHLRKNLESFCFLLASLLASRAHTRSLRRPLLYHNTYLSSGKNLMRFICCWKNGQALLFAKRTGKTRRSSVLGGVTDCFSILEIGYPSCWLSPSSRHFHTKPVQASKSKKVKIAALISSFFF